MGLAGDLERYDSESRPRTYQVWSRVPGFGIRGQKIQVLPLEIEDCMTSVIAEATVRMSYPNSSGLVYEQRRDGV